MVFENRVLTRIIEEFNDVYSSAENGQIPNVKMNGVFSMRNEYKTFVGKPKSKKSLIRIWRRLENNTHSKVKGK
jgi:hypothetical protein